jgi:hypothetical protein
VRSYIIALLFSFAVMNFGNLASGATYNVNALVGGEPGTGVFVWGNVCGKTVCYDNTLRTAVHEFPAGSTLNFGTLALEPFYTSSVGPDVFGGASYIGSMTYTFGQYPDGFPGAPSMMYSSCGNLDQCTIQVPPSVTYSLIFTLPADETRIQLQWTESATYTPPAFLGVVPEPSTWAMLLIGFAGVGYLAPRRCRTPRTTSGLQRHDTADIRRFAAAPDEVSVTALLFVAAPVFDASAAHVR